MAQAILMSKITFAGISGFEYFHIIYKNNGIVIRPLERKQASKVIEDNQLVLAKPETYLGQYDPKLGKIYVDSNFQSTINSNPKQKNLIFQLLENE